MILYTPQGKPFNADKDQVDVLLKAGFKKEPPKPKKDEDPKKDEPPKL